MKIKIASIILFGLFFWVIYPVKWARIANRRNRLNNAIRRAEIMGDELNKNILVVQYSKDKSFLGLKYSRVFFKVGTRAQFRAEATKVTKGLRKNRSGFLDWDYRHSIMYQTR